jgi:hypothetical protein
VGKPVCEINRLELEYYKFCVSTFLLQQHPSLTDCGLV